MFRSRRSCRQACPASEHARASVLVASPRLASRRVASRYVALLHVPPHPTTSHHVTPRHTTLHHRALHVSFARFDTTCRSYDLPLVEAILSGAQ